MPLDRSETIATAPASGPDRPAGAIVEPEPWHAPEWPADDERSPLECRLQAESEHHDRLQPGLQGATSQIHRHREVLAVALSVLALSFALVEVPGGRIAVRGLTRYPLPPSCVSRSLLGVRCPGCGLTRSFIHLAEGDWRRSWACHRLGGLLAAVLIFQIPYRLLALRRPESAPIPPRWQTGLSIVLIALLIINWLADVVRYPPLKGVGLPVDSAGFRGPASSSPAIGRPTRIRALGPVRPNRSAVAPGGVSWVRRTRCSRPFPPGLPPRNPASSLPRPAPTE